MEVISTLISIIYFSANIILLFILGCYVKKQGEYDSIKSKSFVKNIWRQRAIYAPLTVHFYDTATDIGVVYYWYILMIDDNINFEYIDISAFFWCGISFLILYRLLTLIVVSLEVCTGSNVGCCKSHPIDIILVLFDVYIFKAVYQSFKAANIILSKNATNRKRHMEMMEKEIELQTAGTKDENKENDNDEDMGKERVQKKKIADFKGEVIQIHETQLYVQFGEAITESMPQIMLQSVFIILMDDNTNILLILFSIIASLLSVSNKFRIYTNTKLEHCFDQTAKQLNFKKRFPKCMNYWYVLRVIWRFCDVLSKFVVYVLIWSVLGSEWLGIWFGFTIFIWSIWHCVVMDSPCDAFVDVVISMAGLPLYYNYRTVVPFKTFGGHIIRFIENCIGLSIIAISEARQLISGNNRIFIFFIMGSAATVIQLLLFIAFVKYKIL